MPPNRSRGEANDRNQPPAQTPSHRHRPTPSGPSSSTAMSASTTTPESQESLERRVRAANILDRWEELAWIALNTGESIPQVRLQQERILCGLPAVAGGSERSEWEDENEVPWSEVKHLDEKWRKKQLQERLWKEGEGEGEGVKMKLGENVKFVPGLGGGDGEFIVRGIQAGSVQ